MCISFAPSRLSLFGKASYCHIIGYRHAESTAALSLDHRSYLQSDRFFGFNAAFSDNSEIFILGSKKTLAQKKPQLAIAVYHELNNASLARDVVLAVHPGYTVRFRGIYAFDNCIPRPVTLL